MIGLERFALGHDRGASQDHSRIIRLSYHDPTYVRLAQAAYDSWAEVSAEAGAELVIETGGIDIFPAEDAFDRAAYMAAMDACGVPYERLDGAEAMRRFPELRVDESTEVLFQARTGIAAAARANAAHQRLARAHGADLREHARVEAISAAGGEVCVPWTGGRSVPRTLVVCAGPWTNDVLALLGHRLNLAVTREQVVYLEPQDPAAFAPERFPVWIWMQEPCYYGFPVFGEPAVKVAQDGGGEETTADGRSFEPDEDNSRARRRVHARDVPARGRPRAPREDLPLHAAARPRLRARPAARATTTYCSRSAPGHAFKFATQIGRILTELALEGSTPHDISLFRADRGALHDFGAERTWNA